MQIFFSVTRQSFVMSSKISGVVLFLLLFSACLIKPEPLSIKDVEQREKNDLENIFADQEPVTEAITLFEAMARGIKYNLDHRLKMMESLLADKQLNLSQYALLPALVGSTGYNYRSEYSGAYSQSLITGRESLEASTSQEKDILTSDITLMWNILDFGINYMNARQQAEHKLITEQRRRKVMQNIIQDIIYAYWRAAVSEPLLKEMNFILAETGSALDRYREIAKARLQSPRENLEYQRQILESIRLVRELIQRLAPAKTELASLMNLSPGIRFELPEFIIPVTENEKTGNLFLSEDSTDKLGHTALTLRPELREEDYRERISELDVRKAMLKMLPGIDLELGYHTESNEFLYNRNWWDAGARISMNMFNLVSGPVAYETARAQQETDKARRMALGMAVLTQVHLAYQRYGLVKEEYLTAKELDQVNEGLKNQMELEKTGGKADDLALIHSRINALVARMRHYLMYAEMQNAIGRVYNSIGADFIPETSDSFEKRDIQSLAKSLEEGMNRLSGN